MRADTLLSYLEECQTVAASWRVFIVEDGDLGRVGVVQGYDVAKLELDGQAEEITIVVQYPEPSEAQARPMTVSAFLAEFHSLAMEHPTFAVEVSAKITFIVDGERFHRFDMPLRRMAGHGGARLLCIGVDGLRYLEQLVPSDQGEC